MIKYKNTKKQGDAGLGAAIAYFTLQGYSVSIPLSDSQEYDLLVDINGQIKKIQVKSTTYKRNENRSFEVQLSTQGGNQTFSTIKKLNREMIDFLFILTSDNTQYLIPSDKIGAVTILYLGKKYNEYKINGSSFRGGSDCGCKPHVL